MRPLLFALLLGSVIDCPAQQPDPRAFGFTVARLPDPKVSPKHYIRSESTYSIVIYGDNFMRRSDPDKPSYRVHGLERVFDFSSLTSLLTSFYEDFPEDTKDADPHIRSRIPMPNIIYVTYGWNEISRDGRKLVDSMSLKHGVGLFYCEQNAFSINTEELKREGVTPTYDQECRDYYLSRLSEAISKKAQ